MLDYMVLAFLIILGTLFTSIVVGTTFAAAILLVTFNPVDVEVDMRSPKFKISRNSRHPHGNEARSEIIPFPDPQDKNDKPGGR
ncbi:hypothetical protein Pan97_32390 [Bremerella volcania]|uniref:Uncharacterized protein n=1 Tax=Bremerella volcania TaxID=2527984 RepID=A0A518CAI1_9BACT|nr:hypothetical protein [Bremerella volcania]QDU76194.1 hypothetical protein Pan97_32390 [Bremerella volcania]